MPRANRYYIPNQIWHITHRCHQREFLLKFKRDRERWLHWLFEAKKRFGLTILNYIVTSNHIHLLVQDGNQQQVSKSMQLIAGRTAQEFNRRKKRQGAFWEDRYHATAVDCSQYLFQCLVYIDLNMVRAGRVNHPSQWEQSGFNEIQSPRLRYQLINYDKLCQLLGISSLTTLQRDHLSWVESALSNEQLSREDKWTESLAVGSQQFAERYMNALGLKANYRHVSLIDNCHVVKEPLIHYVSDL